MREGYYYTLFIKEKTLRKCTYILGKIRLVEIVAVASRSKHTTSICGLFIRLLG